MPLKANINLKEFLKVGTGDQLEIIVAWGERIINVYHFSLPGNKTLGFEGDILVPQGSAPKNWVLLNMNSEIIINRTSEMKLEVLSQDKIKLINEDYYSLQQSEACFIELNNGIQIVVRFSERTRRQIILDSPLMIGLTELAGLMVALIITTLTGLFVSINKTKILEAPEAEILASVNFEKFKPFVKVKPLENKIIPEIVKQVEPIKPTQEINSSNRSAVPVKENHSKWIQPSKAVDINSQGLLSAIGSVSTRHKLNELRSGSGELIGIAGSASGRSELGTNYGEDESGSMMKDTGVGGKGATTLGISNVGTKGRSNGEAEYGGNQSISGNTRVQLESGGSGEDFIGSIDREAVRKVIKAALPQFKACYEQEYRRNSKLDGRIFVTWEIHANGSAKNARIVKDKSSMNNTLVEDCIRDRMMGLSFPELSDGSWAEVSYPFIFHGQK